MAALECNNTASSFNNSSTENGEALPEEKSLSIDYSEDLWLANSEDSSGPYAQPPNKATASGEAAVAVAAVQSQHGTAVATAYSGTVSTVAAATTAGPAYQPGQQHWAPMGGTQEEEEGGTILQPSATAYLNGNLEQNGMEFHNSSGDEKDFAPLVPAGTYIEAGDTQNKTFTALMPAAGLGVNGEEIQGGFTTMLQGGQQQMVFYGSGERVDSDSSQIISQENMVYEHSSNQIAVMDSQDGSAASGEEGTGEGNLYVAMDNTENNQQAAQEGNFTVIAPAVLNKMENVKMENDGAYATSAAGGNFQNISTLPFVQNGAFPSHSSFPNFGQPGTPGASGRNGASDHNTNGVQGNETEEVTGEYQEQGAIDYDQEDDNSENSNMGEASEFTCQICQEGFDDQAALDAHMENHPPLKSFICETCSKSFATRRYLKYHRKNHCRRASSYEGRSENEEAFPNLEVKRFSCNVCSRPFRVLKCMKVHKKKKHGIMKDFTCPQCAITFTSSQSLIDHPCHPKSPLPNQESHQPVPGVGVIPPVPVTPFMSQRKKKKLRQAKPTCDICGKIFGDRISLDIHRVKHIEEEFYPCDMCAVDTTSDNPTHLAVHFRIKFFTDDNQHILEDQKAAAEAMRVEDGIASPLSSSHSAQTPIHNPSTPNPSSANVSATSGTPHHQNSAGATVYSNPSSIIATAAACTNIINHTPDGMDSQYLEQAGALTASGEYSTIKTENVLSEYGAVIPGQSALPGQQQQPNDGQASYAEYAQGAAAATDHQQPAAGQGQGGEGSSVMKTVVRSKPHICDICNKSFAEPTKLELHYKTNHLEDRPFQCDICDKSFFTKWKLQRHMLSHLETKPHSCPACSKSFVERGKLEAHYRTHLGTKPYKCEHCSKAFTVKSQLTIHVRRIHSADQPFGCEVCGKAFLWKSGLEKHMRKHTHEKPYSCNHCGQKYSQKSNLISHLAKVHNEQHTDIPTQ